MATPDHAPPKHPIDVVFTWVDGNDPAHQAKLGEHLAALGRPRPRAAAPTRFNEVGELEFAVASILRFAPFVRMVHIVTDAQTPPFLRPTATPGAWRQRVRLVDHRDIFADHLDLLPTFNSRSILTMVWRMPDLAEHFVYMADDWALIGPLRPEDWFVDGRPVLRGQLHRQMDLQPARRMRQWLRAMVGLPRETRAPSSLSQSRAAAVAGYGPQFLRVNHVPNPARRSVYEEFYARRPERLRGNALDRLRSPDQFDPVALANHLEMRAGTAVVIDDERLLYLEPATMTADALRAALQGAEADARVVFSCIQSLDQASDENRAMALDWLRRVVGTLQD